jgi:hypothetical protein
MRKSIVFISIILFFAAELLADGGWPQPRRQGYFKLGQSMIRARQFFSPDGSLVPITTTSIYTTSLYGEYGISNRFTGLLNAPLFVRATINNKESTITGAIQPGDAFNSLGDIDLGLKYGLITNGPVVLSASLIFNLPSGQNVGGASELLQTGDGAFNQMLRLDASRSFYPAPIYATLFTAFNNRGAADYNFELGAQRVNYSDEFRWGGEIGWTPSEKLLLNLKWQQVISLFNGSGGGETGNSSIFGNNVEYFSLIPEINYTLAGNWGVSASLGTAWSGRNILGAPSFNVGVFWLLR